MGLPLAVPSCFILTHMFTWLLLRIHNLCPTAPTPAASASSTAPPSSSPTPVPLSHCPLSIRQVMCVTLGVTEGARSCLFSWDSWPLCAPSPGRVDTLFHYPPPFL